MQLGPVRCRQPSLSFLPWLAHSTIALGGASRLTTTAREAGARGPPVHSRIVLLGRPTPQRRCDGPPGGSAYLGWEGWPPASAALFSVHNYDILS